MPTGAYNASLDISVHEAHIDRDSVRDAAIAQAGALFSEIWGDPREARGHKWRWGKKGSKAGTVTGPDAGLWQDFEAGTGGDIFDFWAIEALGLPDARSNFRRVLGDLAAKVGVGPEIESPADQEARRRKAIAREAESQRKAEAESKRKADVTADVLGDLQPLAGTPAEAYLRSRAIEITPGLRVMGYLPPRKSRGKGDLPFADHPSLAVLASDASGKITGGQRIILTRDGERARDRDGDKLAKFGFGAIQGSAVRIPATGNATGGATGPIYICEGPETALTVHEATGGAVWAVLSVKAFKAVTGLGNGPVVLCPDQDEEDSPAAEAFQKAIDTLTARGVAVRVLRSPEEVGSKHDFNDAAQRLGLEAVRAHIREAEALAADKEAATARPREITADEVSEAVADQVKRWLAGDLPQQSLITATLGTGKSRALTSEVTAYAKAHPDQRILIRVPRHDLATDLETAFRSNGIEAGTYRGTEADDPHAPDEKMCRRPSADLRAVLEAGGGVSDLCGPASGCGSCRLRDLCAYRKQDLQAAQVVIIASDALLTRGDQALPAVIQRVKATDPATGAKIVRPDFDFLIMDETAPASWIAESKVDLGVLSSDFPALASDAGHPVEDAGEGEMSNASLFRGLVQLHTFLTSGEELTAERLAWSEGFSAGILRSMRAALWRWRPSLRGDGVGGMDSVKIEESTREKAVLNAAVRQCQALLSALAQGVEDDGDTGPLPQVRIRAGGADCRQRADLHPLATGGRLLLLDATPAPDLLRKWLPDLHILPELRAHDGEGVTRVQLVDSLMPYSACAVGAGRDSDHSRQRKNTIRASVMGKALGAILDGPSGLICPQKSEQYLQSDVPGLIDGQCVEHFQNARGSNDFTGCRTLITLGRPAMRITEAERTAEVIQGNALPEDQRCEEYNKPMRPIRLRDGTSHPVKNERHPHPVVEAVRRSTTEDELDQCQGRGRAVRRGQDNPLLDIRLSSVAGDAPVDVIWTIDHLKALGGFVGLLLSRGVWVTGRDRAKAVRGAVRHSLHSMGIKPASLPDDLCIARVATAKDSALTDTLHDAVRRNPKTGPLIAALDSAFEAEAESVDLLGLSMPLTGWQSVSVRMPDTRRVVQFRVKADTPEIAVKRVSEIAPGCEVEAEKSGRDTAETAALDRLKVALDRHGWMPLTKSAMHGFMSDIWATTSTAHRDLSTLKSEAETATDSVSGGGSEKNGASLGEMILSSGSLTGHTVKLNTPRSTSVSLLDIGSRNDLKSAISYKDSIRISPTSPDFANLYYQGLFLVKFRPAMSECVKRPRIMEAIAFAGSEDDARSRIEAMLGTVSEWQVIRTVAPSAPEVKSEVFQDATPETAINPELTTPEAPANSNLIPSEIIAEIEALVAEDETETPEVTTGAQEATENDLDVDVSDLPPSFWMALTGPNMSRPEIEARRRLRMRLDRYPNPSPRRLSLMGRSTGARFMPFEVAIYARALAALPPAPCQSEPGRFAKMV